MSDIRLLVICVLAVLLPGGCDTADTPSCEGLASLTGDLVIKVNHQGMEREAMVHVPASYDATRATGVVLNLHPFYFDAKWQRGYTRVEQAAELRGWITVHPEGTGTPVGWDGGGCCTEGVVDDVGYIAALLDQLSARLCVDRRRVFAAGFSNGGVMGYRLACEMADRVAAIAVVSGFDATTSCSPARASSLLHIFSKDEPQEKVAGQPVTLPGMTTTVVSKGSVKSVEDRLTLYHCSDGPRATFAKGDVSCQSWSGCDDDAEVELCTITGAGHTWPGAGQDPLLGSALGPTNQDLDATSYILDFFAAHPMP